MLLFTYLPTATVTPTEQLGKIANLVKPCLSQSPLKGLSTSNETMQKLYAYILYGPLLDIANKKVKNDKNVNTLQWQKAYVKLKICAKIFEVRENTACDEKEIRIAI